MIELLADCSMRLAPLIGAALANWAVQSSVLRAVGSGVQVREETGPDDCDAFRNSVYVCEALFSVAVITAACELVNAPTAAVNAPDVAPAGMVIEGGAVTVAELLLIVTIEPLAGAAAESITVQAALPPAVNEPGRQVIELTVTGAKPGATMVSETLWEDCVPGSRAVKVAVWPAVPAAAVAVKDAVVWPARMLNAAGTVTAALSLVIEIEAPPEGAAVDIVTVQETNPPEVKKVDGQFRAEMAKVGGGIPVPPPPVPPPPVTPPPVPPVVTVMLPPVPAAEMAVTLFATAATPLTPSETVPVAPAARVTLTTATVPFAIEFWFNPQIMQAAVPLPVVQTKFLDTAKAALPAVTLTLVTLAVGYVMVHCSDDGSVDIEASDKFKKTFPPAEALPELRARVEV